MSDLTHMSGVWHWLSTAEAKGDWALPSIGYTGFIPMLVVSVFPGTAREGTPQLDKHSSSLCLWHVCYIPLTKASHIARPRVSVDRK